MNLPKLSIDNYQFTILVFILLVIAGVNSFISMPRTEDPPVNVPGASVIVIFPGATPIDLEELVAQPIEEAVNELEDIKRIHTTVKDGLVYVSVEFYFSGDAKKKFDEVVDKVNGISSELPDEILELNYLEWTTSDVVILQLALVSEKATFHDLLNEAENLKKVAQKSKGVKNVEIKAYPQEEVRVSLNFPKMAAMNISLDQVEKAIKSNNANIPGGSLKLSGKNFNIQTSGSFASIGEIENTVVHSYGGRNIYLKDIATVTLAYEDQNYLARVNGERCIFMEVKQKEGYNIFTIREELQTKLTNFSQSLPVGIHLFTVFDQSVWVDQRISYFLGNLLQGILLVGLIVLLTLGFRSSMIVIMAIPLSIIMGLFVVDFSGFGLQQISIAGLVVALGLLVDNSIVMVENINRFRFLGYSPRDASILGASEIGWPVVSATATTVLAFIPLIMMPEASGEFIKSMPVTIIATLIMSLLVALTLTPLITSKIYRKIPVSDSKKESTFTEKKLQKLIEGPYRRVLLYSLKHKLLIISLALIALIGSIVVFQFVGISFFPKAEKPQFLIQINLPEGTNLDKTNQVTIDVEALLDTLSGVSYYASNIGHGNPRIYYNVLEKNYSKNFAEIFIQLDEYNVEEFDDMIASLRKHFSEYAGARIIVKEFEQGHPVEAPIMVFVTGENLGVLKNISEDVERMIREQPGVINLDNQMSKKQIDISIVINRDKASMYGVPVFEIDKTIRAAVSGLGVSKFRDPQGKEYQIILRMPVGDEISPEDFNDIFVTSLSGRQVPLKQLASMEFVEAPSRIKRFDLERTALVTADLEKGINLDDVMNPVIEQLNAYPFPKGYRYVITGEVESRQDSFGGMQIAIIIAMIAIFAVLVLQFKSFLQPLIIYASIPFAVIGMVWALYISGYTFSFSAFIGLISLVGIVVNNAIILVDYTNKLIANGMALKEAIIKAGETRFTPIVLTSLTTIGGLLPLTLRGGTMWAPLGWTIIGGLLVSTFLSLIMVPILYQIFTKANSEI
ncbi:MAG: efflux RND transporter permease subunit [Bacteroidales bacterium]|nr:efflux RND transporter permease subunit [Bacteroidales bacterium]